MFLSSLFSKKNAILGIDIGTSNIKVAQISHGKTPILDTYGIVNTAYQLGGKDDEAAVEQMAKILRTLLSRAGVSAKKCVISFPNSAVFTSVVELPRMTDQELGTAVEFEAKKYVPLSLSEIDLSWTVILGQDPNASNVKILLTAVPKQVTKNYMRMFSLAGLEPTAGEIEALALIRSLIGEAQNSCVIIDIGARNTGINIIENGFLRLSRNLNVGGDTITEKIAQALNISQLRAEQFKKDFGVSNKTFIPDTIKPVLNIIKAEVKQLLTIYLAQNIKIDKIILVGGGANLPGIVEYFEDLNISIELGNPFRTVGFAKEVEPILKRHALSLPISIGLALRKET